MITISATEMQNNFGKYLKEVINGEEIIILKNGVEVAKLVSSSNNISFLSESLVGVLKNDYSKEDIKEELNKKYEDIC